MKKIYKLFLLVIALSGFAGFLFYVIQQRFLIIYWSHGQLVNDVSLGTTRNIMARKQVWLNFWKSDRFYRESVEVLWSSDHHDNLTHLIGNWIAQLQEEKIISRYVSIESIVFSPLSGEGIISFGQSPFEQDWSILEKWYFVEGLLKTVREAGIPVCAFIFLVNNHEMQDDHLDFSRPWLIDGFLNNNP